MARIKCPHCGAGNRESQETDTCWQCGRRFWEPVERQTYALGSLPALGETTSLQPGDLPSSAQLPRWKLLTAALIAVLAALILGVVVIFYVFRGPGPTNRNPATPAPISTNQ